MTDCPHRWEPHFDAPWPVECTEDLCALCGANQPHIHHYTADYQRTRQADGTIYAHVTGYWCICGKTLVVDPGGEIHEA